MVSSQKTISFSFESYGGLETLQLSSLFSRWLNFNAVLICYRVSHDKKSCVGIASFARNKRNSPVNRPRHLGTRKQASTNMTWVTLRVDFVVGFSLLPRAEFPLQVVQFLISLPYSNSFWNDTCRTTLWIMAANNFYLSYLCYLFYYSLISFICLFIYLVFTYLLRPEG